MRDRLVSRFRNGFNALCRIGFKALFNSQFNKTRNPFRLHLDRRLQRWGGLTDERFPKRISCAGGFTDPLLQPPGCLSSLTSQQRPRNQGLQSSQATAVHPLLHQAIGHGPVPFGHRRQQSIRQVGAGWRGKAGRQGHGKVG